MKILNRVPAVSLLVFCFIGLTACSGAIESEDGSEVGSGSCVFYHVTDGEACASTDGYTSACLPCSANTPPCTVELVPLIEPGDGAIIVGPDTKNICR